MRYFKSLAILLLFVLAAPAFAVPYVTKDGGFTVNFPGSQAPTEKDRTTPKGNLNHTALLDLGNAAYVTAWADMGELEAEADKVLDGARDGALGSMNAKLLSEKKLTIGGFPARLLDIESSQPHLRGKAMIILRDQRLISVMGFAAAEIYEEKVLDSFINSFKFK